MKKSKEIIGNFSYSVISNLISFLISIFVVLIIPKLIGVIEYGYWQLFLFYVGYGGFLNFGWNDGIYLRYGGNFYNKLDKSLFFSQFYLTAFFQIIILIIILGFTCTYTELISDRVFIIQMTGLSIFLVNTRSTLLFTLQATNRIKEYAQITIIGRVIYILFLTFFIISGDRSYKSMIFADIIGKLVSFSFATYVCRDIVFRRISTFYFSFREAYENIRVGIKLMFANIASTLIIGTVRFGIEQSWNVVTFGKVSLTLSVSSILMLFINAIGLVLFPVLRRAKEENLPSIYATLRDFLMVILFGTLIIYYPLKEVLSSWLPKYEESLMYMALLFPICVFEGKMALLINTYLKTLRKEKLIMKINIYTLALSVISTAILTTVFKDLNMVIVSIVFLLAFRCIIAELLLSKILKISLHIDIILELIMTFIFILSGWFIDSWATVLIYGLSYILYLFIKRKDILNTISRMKKLMKV